MLVVLSLGISTVEAGCEEHPDKKARTAKARSDILYSLCVCFMIELITVLKTPVAHGLWI
jgi:hypothetical protein